MRARPVAAPAVVAGAFLAIASAGFAAVPQPGRILLRPAQIGRGYRLVIRSDSTCVSGCATLDLCGFTFASEALRTARLQVNYARAGRPVTLSNEVVTYRPGGAREAIAEIDRAVARCPRTPVSTTVQGAGPLTFRLGRIAGRGLLRGYVALRLRIAGLVNGRHVDQTLVVVYQAHGDVLSGVYAYPAAGVSLADQIRVGLRAAAASARNLVAATG